MVKMKTIATLAATCPPLLQGALDADEADHLAAALRVIADPARLRLLSLIQAQPDHEACVCNLTEPVGLSQPTVSHHLKVLREAGLLASERRASWVYYRLVPERMALLARLFSAEPTWGSVPVKSRWIESSWTVRATWMRTGTSERRSSSMYSVNR